MRKSPLVPLIVAGLLIAAGVALWTTLERDVPAPPPIDLPTANDTARSAPQRGPVGDASGVDVDPLPATAIVESTAPAPDEPLDPIDEKDLETSITGRVVTPAAVPARGATVTLLRQLAGTALRPGKLKRAQPPAAVADDGSFGFAGLAAGATYVVRAEHPDYPPALTPSVRARKDEMTELPDVEFIVGCSIIGSVVDEHGRAMKAARVLLFDLVRGGPQLTPQDRTAVAVVTTDEQGGFKLERLAPGIYEIMVTAPRYESAFISNIDISSPRAERRVPVSLAPGHSIAGKVVDLTGAAVAGARVRATQVTKAVRRFGSALTQADGRYRIDGLGVGEYRMTVEKAGYSSAQRPRVPADSMRVHFRIGQNAGITGFVVATDGTTPVPAFGIMLHALGKHDYPNQSLGGMRSFSARDGSFTLEDVPPGRYKLHVFAEGFGPTWSDVIVVGQIFVHGTKVVLEAGAEIVGRVADVDGTPVAGATVLLVENSFRRHPSAALIYGAYTHYARTKTDAEGSFSMRDIEPKQYQIEVQMAQRMPLSLRDVDIVRGVNDLGVLRLEIGGGIKGTVLNERGQPANAARVSASHQTLGIANEAVCDEEGQFELPNLEPGEWNLVPAPAPTDAFATHPLSAITVALFSQMTVTVADGRTEIVTLPMKTSK